MLSVENLRSGYGRIEALHGVSIEVAAGEIVTLVGANGAGKTTLLRAISGVQPVSGGRILYQGRAIERMPAHERVALGIAQVPEGRQLFGPLSVEDNLKLGAWTRPATNVEAELEPIFALFPMLAGMRHAAAGTLSGGQQQMLAVGRALMGKPKLLLLDEPSMGLAPILVDQILKDVVRLRDGGLDCAAGRAERAGGARHRRPRLCGRDRTDRRKRTQRRLARRRSRPGRLSRSVTSRHESPRIGGAAHGPYDQMLGAPSHPRPLFQHRRGTEQRARRRYRGVQTRSTREKIIPRMPLMVDCSSREQPL